MIKKLKDRYWYILQDKHLKEIFEWSFISFLTKILWVILAFTSSIIISKYYWAEWMWKLDLVKRFLSISMMIWSLGLSVSVLRYIWEYKAKEKFYKIKLLYKNLLEIIIPFSIIIVLISYILIPYISNQLLEKSEMTIPLKISVLFVPLFILHSVNIEFIRWLKKIKTSEFLRNITTPILTITSIIILTTLYYNTLNPITSFMIVISINFIISGSIIIKILKKHQKIEKIKEKIKKIDIIKTSLPMIATSFSFLIMWTADSFMIWRFTNLWNVWIYSVVLSLATIISFVLSSINTIIWPKISELYWKDDKNNLRRVVSYSSRLIFLTTTPILILLILLWKFFLWFYGSEFVSWYNVLLILIIGQFINASCWPVWFFLNMTWKQVVFRNIILIALVINIVLNYLLIPVYWLVWAATATSISTIFWNITGALYIKLKFNILTIYIPLIRKYVR